MTRSGSASTKPRASETSRVMTSDSPAAEEGAQNQTWETIRRVLNAARDQLEMDLVLLGEFTDTNEVFRAVAGDAGSFGLAEGTTLPRAETYCQAMIEGRVDNVIPDTSAVPAVARLEITGVGNVGRYVGVPVRLPDGRLYGALCGLGHETDPGLRARDARFLGVLATVVEAELGREQVQVARRAALTTRIEPLLDGNGLSMVFQPIVDLPRGTISGFEALARFAAETHRAPDAWFADAAEIGLGVELELLAVTAALSSLDRLPSGSFLSVNVSPTTACSPALADALGAVDSSRIVLEITEHAAVMDYSLLMSALSHLRGAGVRLAVDDAGAGVASLHHILALAPELIKMDISLTRGIDADPARAALASALVTFAAATGAHILAEGIETTAERDAVRRLGVTYGQGYLLGRPATLGTEEPPASRPDHRREYRLPPTPSAAREGTTPQPTHYARS